MYKKLASTNKKKNEFLQDFIWNVSYGKIDDINGLTLEERSQALDYCLLLLAYCESSHANIPEGLRVPSEFFALPSVEKFYTQLIDNLPTDSYPTSEAVFRRGLVFIVKYIGPPKSREIVQLLLNRLQIRFPELKTMYDHVIDNVTKAFTLLTIGEFLNLYSEAVDYLQKTYPLIFQLFVAPLYAKRFEKQKLYNFYCNPWLYHRIMRYIACWRSQGINHEQLSKSMGWLQAYLNTISSRVSAESWKELTRKAENSLNHSKNLESFAIETAGLQGEIITAAQFIQTQCAPKDQFDFLSERADGKNCDFMITRHATGIIELIECKTKTPMHGLDNKIFGDLQIWDDFFTNFSSPISSYLIYLGNTFSSKLGLSIQDLFPLFMAYEGTNYGFALSLITNIPMAEGTVLLKDWKSEQKVTHLLRSLFLNPLVLSSCCMQLSSDELRLAQRQQATQTALQKEWVSNLIQKAITQLKETYQDLTAKGYKITKMHVTLSLELSYRLSHDPFDYDDGNIIQIAEETLRTTFRSFQENPLAQNPQLELFIPRIF